MAAVGLVVGVVGRVTATDRRGHARVLNEGEAVAQDDIIHCERGASIHIEFIRSGYITLGGGDTVQLTEELVRRINTSSQKRVEADADLFEVASQDVLDLNDLLDPLDHSGTLHFHVKTIGNEKFIALGTEYPESSVGLDHVAGAQSDFGPMAIAAPTAEVFNVLTQLEQPNHWIG